MSKRSETFCIVRTFGKYHVRAGWFALLAGIASSLAAGPGPCKSAQLSAPAESRVLDARIASVPYLRMPHRADGRMPKLLSQTGALANVRTLTMSPGLIPYDLRVSFWSDGADKTRWMSLPDEKIQFSASGEWRYPRGTVFIKTFELALDARDPNLKRRLETRILVCDELGGVYGVDYKWRSDNSDADLLTDGRTEAVPVRYVDGNTHSQSWYYPSRQDCLTCHNERAGGVLGPKTRQLNHEYRYPNGVMDNELRAWNRLGLFEPAIPIDRFATFASLAAASDDSRSLEDRARSYLDANCAHCHRPDGTVANFDARFSTPLDKQELVDGPVLINEGIDRPRVIAPHDTWRSIALMRVDTVGEIKMPPLARNTIDADGVKLLRKWIDSMPGRPVLAPPRIAPAGGAFESPIEVTLNEPEAGAEIRYTLDGSVPGASDLRYEKPIELTGPAVIRTRAYKNGFMRSIVAQEVFVIGSDAVHSRSAATGSSVRDSH